MNVRELDYEELLELKEMLCYGADILPEMTDEQKRICEEAFSSDDIPDELVYELYDEISFVKEDFWCNIEQEED